jgi:hypothetical protein
MKLVTITLFDFECSCVELREAVCCNRNNVKVSRMFSTYAEDLGVDRIILKHMLRTEFWCD